MSAKRKEASSIEEMTTRLREDIGQVAQEFENLLLVDWDTLENIHAVYVDLQFIEYELRKIRIAKKMIWRRLLSKMGKNINNTSDKSGT